MMIQKERNISISLLNLSPFPLLLLFPLFLSFSTPFALKKTFQQKWTLAYELVACHGLAHVYSRYWNTNKRGHRVARVGKNNLTAFCYPLKKLNAHVLYFWCFILWLIFCFCFLKGLFTETIIRKTRFWSSRIILLICTCSSFKLNNHWITFIRVFITLQQFKHTLPSIVITSHYYSNL